jgi:hypothetical protein
LLGSAGTGKSWFQAFFLRRLLLEADSNNVDDSTFKFVVRQVADAFYLIDLTTCQVFAWNFNVLSPGTILEQLRKTVYFFEPGGNISLFPLCLWIPSLATLSPFEERIKEYTKGASAVRLYLPDWTAPQLCGVAEDDESMSLSVDDIHERFTKVGGIIRHILAPDIAVIEKSQATKVHEVSIEVLRSLGANVDRETKGLNVSGYLLCYTNVPVTGDRRFMDSELAYTSSAVENTIRFKFHTFSNVENFRAVLGRLNKLNDDKSGMHLELAGTHLLSLGSIVKWTCTQVGQVTGRQWEDFSCFARDVLATSDVGGVLFQAKKIIKSSNSNFPAVDIVFSVGSIPDDGTRIDAIQFSWQPSHPITLRALYDLRVNHLRIDNKRTVRILFMVPNNELVYASRDKSSFLKGNADVDLRYSAQLIVPSADLHIMWQNTQVFVVKPIKGWQIVLADNMHLVPGA